MSEPFLAEIKIIGFNFAPRGWAYCDGQILPINQNQSLYSLLGTNYGGDGRTSFALPDLRSRSPLHKGDYYQLAQKGGEETTTLVGSQLAAHTHSFQAAVDNGDKFTIKNNRVLGQSTNFIYGDVAALTSMNSGTGATTGGGQAHSNMQPSLTLAFVIALKGLFPSRN